MPFALFQVTATVQIVTVSREMSISILRHCLGTQTHSQLPQTLL